jgi:hypothetical protein
LTSSCSAAFARLASALDLDCTAGRGGQGISSAAMTSSQGAVKQSSSTAGGSGPLIPLSVFDAPSQRVYLASAFLLLEVSQGSLAISGYRAYDFNDDLAGI